jgi:hypothetical protein
VTELGLPFARSLADRARRFFVTPETPLVAVEVRPRSVGIVRVGRDKGRRILAVAASLELPEGTIALSLSQANVMRPDAFREALGALVQKLGLARGTRIGLVLPDTVARVALVPVAEIKARGRAEVDELIRFRLRKSVPFDTRESEVACVFPEGAEVAAVAAVVSRSVLDGYEEGCRSVGLHAGLVELSGLALLGAGAAPGDRLLVNWDEGYVSLILARNGWPLLVRTLAGVPASSAEDVAREVENTAQYYRERLGGGGLQLVSLRSACLPAAEALTIVAQAVGMAVQLIEPAMGAVVPPGATAQALAGAAACVLREAA